MFQIRTDQLAGLRASRMSAFERAMEEHLRLHYAEFTRRLERTEDDGVRGHVHATARAAIGHGIDDDAGLLIFLELTVAWGPTLDAAPDPRWVQGYLEDQDVPSARERIARLHAAVRRREQQEEHNERVREEFWRGRR